MDGGTRLGRRTRHAASIRRPSFTSGGGGVAVTPSGCLIAVSVSRMPATSSCVLADVELLVEERDEQAVAGHHDPGEHRAADPPIPATNVIATRFSDANTPNVGPETVWVW